jgi:hypothetical protein
MADKELNAVFGVNFRGLWRVDSRNASTHVSSHVIVVLAKLRSPASHAGFFVRIYGSVPIRLVSLTQYCSSAVLYIFRVDFSTEDRYIA